MNRFITDPQSIKNQDLQNQYWDIIELNATVDHIAMMEWYSQVKEQLSGAKFSVAPDDIKKYLDPQYWKAWIGIDPTIVGTNSQYVHWWSLQWFVERYDPLPWPHFANKTLFPETDVDGDELDNQEMPLLKKYIFGAFAELYTKLKPYFSSASRITVIPPGAGLRVHSDVSPPYVLIRAHIKLDNNDQASWFFGAHCEREYVLETGKMYLVNTSVEHAVVNFGERDWVILHFTPDDYQIDDLLGLTGKL